MGTRLEHKNRARVSVTDVTEFLQLGALTESAQKIAKTILEVLDSSPIAPRLVGLNREYDDGTFKELVGAGLKGQLTAKNIKRLMQYLTSSTNLPKDTIDKFLKFLPGLAIGGIVADGENDTILRGDFTLELLPLGISNDLQGLLSKAVGAGADNPVTITFPEVTISNTDSYLGGFLNPEGGVGKSTVDNVVEFSVKVGVEINGGSVEYVQARYVIDTRTYQVEENGERRAVTVQQKYFDLSAANGVLDLLGVDPVFASGYVLGMEAWDFSTRQKVDVKFQAGATIGAPIVIESVGPDLGPSRAARDTLRVSTGGGNYIIYGQDYNVHVNFDANGERTLQYHDCSPSAPMAQI